ncbi:MAG: ATP-binding protein [Deltaproteobacteria bacterium]|nr:ATP-binding protein [Deltaproteobacteria bacterium]
MVKIASVESNRVTGRGSILLVHRVTSPTDIFLGVVVATLAKNRFEKLFSTVLPSSRSAIAMYTLDGTRLVQESKFTGAAGSALDTNRHFEELLSQANYDQHRIPVTEPDESALLVSLHSVRGYPLVIEVANSEKKVLTEWSRIAWLTILFAGGAIILISVLSFALVRQWRMEGEIIQTKELQRLNNDLLRSERLLKAVFDVIPHYLFIRNTEGRMVMVNAAFAQFFGLHPEEIMGKPLSEITRNAEIINQWEEKDRLILQEGQIVRSPEFSVTRADGVNRWIHIIKLPLRGENDSIIGLVGLAEDTTERVQAEQRFRQSQKMEAVGQLAGGIAHDFNNMLQIIRGYADLVSQSMPPEFQYKKEIGHVIQAADNAAALTRQLLAFSRTQAAVLERLDLVDLLNEQSHMFSRLIGDHIEFSIHSQTDSVFVVADPLQLQQVLLNLCVNARDAMPNGGRLTIEIQTFHADDEFCTRNSWAKSGDYAVIVVSDTGKGMAKEVQDHIFEPFFTTKEVGQGTGLGLFTVYGIVRQHGGMVHCYSEPGLGTTFRIYLPLGSSTVTKSAPQVSKPVVRGGHETVLIAEDHDDVRAYLAQLLEQNGYQVLQARSGEEAITQFEAHQNTVSLILSDMVMPKLSGADLFRHVNKINPGLPMIILTGYAGNLSQTLPVNSGVLKIVQKPYGPDDLLKEIREALDTPA